MSHDEININFKTLIKVLIVLIIVTIIFIPVGAIVYLQMNTPSFTFNYVNPDNIMQQLTRDVSFDSRDKGVNIRITSDMVNSLLQDEFAKLDLGLPEQVEIDMVYLNMANNRLYVNAKAFGVYIPLSAGIRIRQTSTHINLTVTDVRLANLQFDQDFIDQQLGDMLSYSMPLRELDVIPFFVIKSVSWRAAGFTLFYELDYNAVYNLLRQNPEQMAREIENLVQANPSLEPMLDLVMYLTRAEELTLREIRYYMDILMENQAVADALLEMARTGQI